MKSDRAATSKLPDFYFDEMVWRTDNGLVDQARTALTSIHDDVEFERQIFLIRVARSMSGLDQGDASRVGKFSEKFFSVGFESTLFLCKFILCFRKIQIRLFNKFAVR
jgi:hypothetical protein